MDRGKQKKNKKRELKRKRIREGKERQHRIDRAAVSAIAAFEA